MTCPAPAHSTCRHGHLWAALCFAAVLPVFFWDMFFQGKGFFYGDYATQYYPWAVELSLALKRGTLPFWTDLVGCGFPLLAEGQAGALHPAKAALYGLLPIQWAYPMGFWFLFWIAGCCSYRFLRRLGASWTAGLVAGLTYTYGSAYAGLAWGNASLWVLAWLPWAVDRTEALCQNGSGRRAAWLAVALAFMWLGGIPQMALYATLFILGYALIRQGAVRWAAAASGLGVVLASAQLLPTLELVGMSARSRTGLDFALQKSLNPASLASFLQPSLGFLGAELYMGLLPFVLALLALTGWRRQRPVLALAVLAAGSIALALGRWNPLYVAAVDAMHLYAFRSPSKWTMFALFGLAALAGLGWDRWWGSETGIRKRSAWLGSVLAASAALWLTAFWAARKWAPLLLSWGEEYVKRQVYGKDGHPHSLEAYLDRLPGYVDVLIRRTSFENYSLRCTAVLAACLVGWLVLNRLKGDRPLVKAVGLLLIAADLFAFSFVGSGFKGNRVSADSVGTDAAARALSAETGLFRAYEFKLDPLAAPKLTTPNANLIHRYAQIGIYTPLVSEAYRDRTDGMGAVDDSTGAAARSAWVPLEEWLSLSRMNVRFLIAREPLERPGPWVDPVPLEDGAVLYRNSDEWPRAYRPVPAGRSRGEDDAVIQASGPGYYAIRTEFDEPGELVVSENGLFGEHAWNSGWRATLDGQPAAIRPADGCFLSIPVPEGRHQIRFFYVPTVFWIGVGGTLAGLLVCAVLIGAGNRRKEPRAS